MSGTKARALVFSLVTLAPAVLAQNALQHMDGTTEGTWRGALGQAQGTLLQRIPGDQAAGRTALHSVVARIQDQEVTTPENLTLEIRANDPFNPNRPDMSPAGLLGSVGPLTITIPGPPGAQAMELTGTPSIPVPLPPGTPLVPDGDIYVGFALPPAPRWGGNPNDGLSVWCSGVIWSPGPGEQMRNVVGYTANVTNPPVNPPQAGLGWNVLTGIGAVELVSGNCSWHIRTQFVDDVLQPYAYNPTVFTGIGGNGQNPNYGYAGIFPDEGRPTGPDGIGFRLFATAPVGSGVLLFIGFGALPAPVSFPGINGSLVLNPGMMLNIGAASTVARPYGYPASSSMAVFPPLSGHPAFVGFIVYAQAVTIPPGAPLSISTMCSIHF